MREPEPETQRKKHEPIKDTKRNVQQNEWKRKKK